MRLLDTSTLELHEFFGSQIPYYAILSHRWGDEEVTFQDLQQGRGPKMAGWEKIFGCCRQARKEGWEWAWVDSCCIDKSSSAELSEAINSMFKWYQDAEVCYAYLADVPVDESDPEREESAFRKSQWFTRGWTLQELLAPETVVFFNHGWIDIGTKLSLEGLIAAITDIDERFLTYCSLASVAQKFSWASRRQTLRVEDTAYCLMGLFGVHMPLLYGEGDKAFKRLQLQIMNVSHDHSLFAWADQTAGEELATGLLAESPAAFRYSGGVVNSNMSPSPYSMTNVGLRISLPLLQKTKNESLFSSMNISGGDMTAIAPLNCNIWSTGPAGRGREERILLYLLEDFDNKIYLRRSTNKLLHAPSQYLQAQQIKEIFVADRTYSSRLYQPRNQISKLQIDAQKAISNGFIVSDIREIHEGNRPYARGNTGRILASQNASNGRYFCELELSSPGLFVRLESFRPRQYFGLQVESVFRTSPFIRLLPLSRKSFDLLDSPDRMTIEQLFPENGEKRYDRATTTLVSGQVISAVLKKQLQDGELMYVIELDMKPPAIDSPSSGSTTGEHSHTTRKWKRSAN